MPTAQPAIDSGAFAGEQACKIRMVNKIRWLVFIELNDKYNESKSKDKNLRWLDFVDYFKAKTTYSGTQ